MPFYMKNTSWLVHRELTNSTRCAVQNTLTMSSPCS
uniref:Uncharacterized protein n=1 Tax=Arundo donax TaxID=35708 RepID=A0A0A9ASL2_ARUDO